VNTASLPVFEKDIPHIKSWYRNIVAALLCNIDVRERSTGKAANSSGCHVDVSIVVQGIIIGLILAVPVGPLALMCIQRSLSDGRLHGIISGFGVATADSLYATVAFLGLTAISGFILSWQDFFRFFAGLVLVIVGTRIFFIRPDTEGEKSPHESYAKDYLSMVAIGIANPMTLIFLMVTLPGFGFSFGGTSVILAAEFVAGFFCGSAAWWIFLCGTLGSVRSRISAGNLALINRVSGVFIVSVGAVMLISLILAMAGTPGP
jgi:threonine/homoserine/homoserine lactone efflux protein